MPLLEWLITALCSRTLLLEDFLGCSSVPAWRQVHLQHSASLLIQRFEPHVVARTQRDGRVPDTDT